MKVIYVDCDSKHDDICKIFDKRVIFDKIIYKKIGNYKQNC